jgi:hypothetical protein
MRNMYFCFKKAEFAIHAMHAPFVIMAGYSASLLLDEQYQTGLGTFHQVLVKYKLWTEQVDIAVRLFLHSKGVIIDFNLAGCHA